MCKSALALLFVLSLRMTDCKKKRETKLSYIYLYRYYGSCNELISACPFERLYTLYSIRTRVVIIVENTKKQRSISIQMKRFILTATGNTNPCIHNWQFYVWQMNRLFINTFFSVLEINGFRPFFILFASSSDSSCKLIFILPSERSWRTKWNHLMKKHCRLKQMKRVEHVYHKTSQLCNPSPRLNLCIQIARNCR